MHQPLYQIILCEKINYLCTTSIVFPLRSRTPKLLACSHSTPTVISYASVSRIPFMLITEPHGWSAVCASHYNPSKQSCAWWISGMVSRRC